MAETNLDTIPGGNVPSDQSENDMHAALDENYLKLYGFSFQETYRHALRFYKGKKDHHILQMFVLHPSIYNCPRFLKLAGIKSTFISTFRKREQIVQCQFKLQR